MLFLHPSTLKQENNIETGTKKKEGGIVLLSGMWYVSWVYLGCLLFCFFYRVYIFLPKKGGGVEKSL